MTLKLLPGAKTLNMAALSSFKNEQEATAMGRFQAVAKEKDKRGNVVVTLKQKETW